MSENTPPKGSATTAASPAAAKTAAAPPAPSATAPTTMDALTPAQKKAQAKAEKAARRSQAVAAKVVPPTPAASAASPAAKAPKKTTTATGAPTPVPVVAQKPKGPQIPDAYSHLSIAKKLPLSKADKDVHPSILAIGQQMANFTLKDNAARLEAMLVAFMKVMECYETPAGQTFVRLVQNQCLNPQIEYLIGCRPMCFSMGNAIRMLKAKIANLIELNVPDEEARRTLRQVIEMYIQERILGAEDAIVSKAVTIIEDGENILTYGHARLVQLSLQKAHTEGRTFEVTILDDPWDPSGEELAKILRDGGIKVNYYPDTNIGTNIKNVSKLMLGAEAMFANGTLYAPAGTRQLALEAKEADIPVVALLETVNCDRERVSVDTMTHNEIDPEACTDGLFRLLFDTTPGRDISIVVTESEEANASGSSSAILSALKRLDDRHANSN
ncbi:unnamed protein product [Discula destructiva]